MAFAPPVKAKVSSHMAKSTWTPLNNPSSNNQVFEERREILKKWFSNWQDKQKKVIVGDILQSLSTRHLVELHENLNCKFPTERFDFTKILPRVLTLYLFSFLDPRTLCRCAQVSWYWNYLTELDCLWRPKCLRFGWYPTYQPTPFEEKIWKRFYVKTVHELNYAKPKIREVEEGGERKRTPPDTGRSLVSRGSSRSHMSTTSTLGMKRGPQVGSSRRPLPSAKWEPPPWRGSDPNPVDTVRYNYLNNTSKYVKNSPSKSRPATASKRSPTTGDHTNLTRSMNSTTDYHPRPRSSRTPRTPKPNKPKNPSPDEAATHNLNNTPRSQAPLETIRSVDSTRSSIKSKSLKPRAEVTDVAETRSVGRESVQSGKRSTVSASRGVEAETGAAVEDAKMAPAAPPSVMGDVVEEHVKLSENIESKLSVKDNDDDGGDQVKVDHSLSELSGTRWKTADLNSDEEDDLDF